MTTPEERAERRRLVVEYTNQRIPTAEIAHTLGVSERTVGTDRRAMGVQDWVHPSDDAAEKRRRLVEQYTAAGWSAKAIARELGMTARNVSRDRRALGISQPVAARLTAEELAIAERMISDGASIQEVGRTIGRSPEGALGVRFKGRGWSFEQRSLYNAARRREIALFGRD